MGHFAKARRLLKRSDYDHVFAKAKKMIASEYIIFFRSNSLGYARLGLALSKKKIAKAHDRNRVKRLIRESFRIQLLPAVDIVFLARQELAGVENKKLTNELGKSWEKLAVLYK